MTDTFIDTHCHLFMMEGEPATHVSEALAAGVEAMVCVGIDPESSRRSRDLADAREGVFATAGVHPHEATAFDAVAGRVIEELLADPRVVAVGETGLDHFRLHSPADDQERVLRAHCGLAREHHKPIVIHAREAWADVFRVLEEERLERVVLHCFSGGEAEAKEAAARGYHCSFAGPVTYPKNDALRAAAAALPAELLLVETDSPFLPPQDLRGTGNVPANVSQVVAAVAAARGEDPSAVAALTVRNARAAFSLPA
ncbi:MAG TPA: TatD family hydrolase [Actinomycetota bacterium]